MAIAQFGINVATSAAPGADPVAAARRAEDLGFDFVSSSDHPCGSAPTYETWTMLTWLAAATSRIRIATRVLGVPYRPPAMVAKMAETLDRLSGGRLILGLGGGYSDEEFRAFGLPVPTPAQKVTGLAEAIQIARGLWSEPAFTFTGRQFHTDAADMEPKAARRIPIWVGTYGPRALAVTGRFADGWIPSVGSAAPEEIPAMRDQIMAAARDAGRDPDEITCVYNVEILLGDTPAVRPTVVAGSADAVAERLISFGRLGFTAVNLMLAGDAAHQAEQAEWAAREVLPAVRAG